VNLVRLPGSDRRRESDRRLPGKGAAKAKVALKGDLSLLGLDRLVVTAYSKDARDSLDVLTATLQ